MCLECGLDWSVLSLFRLDQFDVLSPFHFPKQHFHMISSTRTRIAIAKLVSKSYEEMGRRTYKNVPVTALTARRVRHGVGADFICQPSPSPGIKTHSSPAAFSNNFLPPFFPSLFVLLNGMFGRKRINTNLTGKCSGTWIRCRYGT